MFVRYINLVSIALIMCMIVFMGQPRYEELVSTDYVMLQKYYDLETQSNKRHIDLQTQIYNLKEYISKSDSLHAQELEKLLTLQRNLEYRQSISDHASNIEERIDAMVKPTVKLFCAAESGSGVIIYSEIYDESRDITEDSDEEPEIGPELPPVPPRDDSDRWEDDWDGDDKWWDKDEEDTSWDDEGESKIQPQEEEEEEEEGAYQTYILSARHIINNGAIFGAPIVTAKVYDVDGKEIMSLRCEVAYQHKVADILILSARTEEPLPTAAMYDHQDMGEISMHEKAYNVGCPIALNIAITSGYIFTKQRDELSNLWGSTANAVFGNSGGGVFLADTYQLIGIVVQIPILKMGPISQIPVMHISFFRPLDQIVERIKLDKPELGFLFGIE
jgi:hypothetical protein